MEGAGPYAAALARFRKSPVGLVGAGLVAAFVAASLLAPLLSPYDPLAPDFAAVLAPPSLAHPFGTDDLGRDILSRVLHGGRVSLQAGLLTVAFALAVGVPLGLAAGFFGGRVDNLVMRGIEVVLSFPTLVLALGITAVLGPKLIHALLAIGIVFVPHFARLIRGQVLSVKENDYVSAARALGASDPRVMGLHVLPNCLAPILVQSTFSVALGILIEAALSFLGLGTQPPTPSWGIMLSTGRAYLEQAPWLGLFPGLAVFATVLGFNMLGDGIRDALDPRL
ncbi:MAG TPA: ABC transporter permease [Thermodesulfobacteriota bacterium]